jgi:hypothetical protein
MDFYVQTTGNLLQMLVLFPEKVRCQEIVLEYHLGARAISGPPVILSGVHFHKEKDLYHRSTQYCKQQRTGGSGPSGRPEMA